MQIYSRRARAPHAVSVYNYRGIIINFIAIIILLLLYAIGRQSLVAAEGAIFIVAQIPVRRRGEGGKCYILGRDMQQRGCAVWLIVM